MMDTLWICGEEIALEGLDGCPIPKLWQNLAQRKPPIPTKLDDGVKAYLWKGIVESLDVKFYVLEKPLLHLVDRDKSIKEESRKNITSHMQDIHDNASVQLAFNSFNMITDEDIRGSCPEYKTRKDITSDIRSNAGQCIVGLQQAVERWGDHFVIVASQHMRTRALIGDDLDPDVPITPIHYCLLEHVGQSRTYGRLQRFISSYLNIDAKTLFFMLKTLSKMGLIKKQKSVAPSVKSNMASNVIHLKKFSFLPKHGYHMLAVEMCQFLETQPNKIISIMELTKHFDKVVGITRRRTMKRVRKYLEKLGNVKTVIMPDKEKYYVQLITPLVLNEDGDDDEENQDNVDEVLDYPNLVIELPIVKQVYDFIENKGPDGATNKDIEDHFQIFKYDHRACIKFLEAKGHVKHVTIFSGRQSVMRFVAMPYLESSKLTQEILEEKKKLDDMREKVSMQALEDDTSNTASTKMSDSRCSSPTPSVQSVAPPKGKKVTYRNLKRNNFIINFLKEKKVVEGEYNIKKALIQAELKEGLETKVCKKNLQRTLAQLTDEGLIKKLKTIIDDNNTTHIVEFFLHSSVNPHDEEVKAAIEACRFRLSEVEKAPLAPVKNKSDHEEEEESNVEIVSWKHDMRYSYGYLAKLPRMQLIHQFIWQALFSEIKKQQDYATPYQLECSGQVVECGSIVDIDGITQTSMAEQNPEMCETPQLRDLNTGTPHLTGLTTGTPQLVDLTTGTLQQVDLATGTPQLIDLTTATISQSNIAVQTSEMTQQKMQPIKVKTATTTQSTRAKCTGELNLTTHNYGWIGHLHPLPKYADKPKGWFKLYDLLKIMPLSVFCNAIGVSRRNDKLDEYYNDPTKCHTAFKDLPIQVKRQFKYNGRYKTAFCEIISNLMYAGLLSPEKPLPSERLQTMVHFSQGAIVVDTSKGFHVGDFDVRTCEDLTQHQFVFNNYSDLQAYWTELKYICLRTSYMVTSRYHNRKEADKTTADNEVSHTNEQLKKSRNLKFTDCKAELITEDNILPPPGDGRGAAGLDAILYSHLTKNWTFHSGEYNKFRVFSSEKRKLQTGESAKPPRKKQKSEQHGKKAKRKQPDIKAVPSKKQKTDETKTSQKESSVSLPLQLSGHIIAVDEADKAALAKKVGIRTSFSPENDRILLLSRVALELMGLKFSRDPLYFAQIRNLVHKMCPDSLDKTAQNCRARILRLMKNPKNIMTVKVCVAEYISMPEFARVNDKSLPSKEIFNKTINKIIKLSSNQGTSVENTSQLVSSIDELHDNYRLQKLSKDDQLLGYEQPISLGNPLSMAQDIRHAVAKNIIQITCENHLKSSSGSSSYRMLENYSLEEIAKAGKDLTKAGVIRITKDKLKKTRSKPYKSSFEYTKLLDPSPRLFITRPTYEVACKFMDNCLSVGQPASRKIVRLKDTTICGGKLAAFLSLLLTGKVTAEWHIPDQVLEQTVEPTKEQPQPKTTSKTKSKQAKPDQNKTKETEEENRDFEEKNEGKSVQRQETQSVLEERTEEEEKDEQCGGSACKTSMTKASSSTTAGTKKICKEKDHPSDSNVANMPRKETNSNGINHGQQNTTGFKEKTSNPAMYSKGMKKNKDSKKLKPMLNPFDGNDALTHCKFNTTFDVSDVDSRLFTPHRVSMSSHSNGSSEGTVLGRPTRTSQMPSQNHTQPELFKSQGYNSLDYFKIQHCDVIVRPKTTKITSMVSKKNGHDVSMDTRDQETVPKDSAGCSKDPTKVEQTDEKDNQRDVTKTMSDSQSIGSASNTMSSNTMSSNTMSSVAMDFNINPEKECKWFERYPFWIDYDELIKEAPSLNEYLERCKADTCFNVADEQVTRIIYRSACDGKEMGTTIDETMQTVSENSSLLQEMSRSIQEHFDNICKSKMLLKLGMFKERYVVPSYAKVWSITLTKETDDQPVKNDDSSTENHNQQPSSLTEVTEAMTPVSSMETVLSPSLATDDNASVTNNQSLIPEDVTQSINVTTSERITEGDGTQSMTGSENKSPVECRNIITRPWLDMNGQVSMDMLKSLLYVVTAAVIKHPGITETSICKMFIQAAQPVPLSFVLKYLVDIGCITKHEMTAKKPKLFSSDSSRVSYFLPCVDSIVKLGKATQKMTT